MKVIKCRVSSNVEATIKVSWLKQKDLKIPTRKVMYMFSDPLNWGEIDKLEINKETLKDISDTIFNSLETNNQQLAELLLKIAGEHPNSYENDFINKMLTDREFAIQQRNMMM